MKPLSVVLPLLASVIGLNIAHAGCVGGSIGDACIGIPTPTEHERAPVVIEHEHPPVIIEKHEHHDAPVIIEHHHDEDDED